MSEKPNSSWNLDEVDEGFEFVLGGHTYIFRYPTTEEAEKSSKVAEGEQLEWLKRFVSSKDPEAPDFATVLGKQNIKVLKRFVKMVTTELEAED